MPLLRFRFRNRFWRFLVGSLALLLCSQVFSQSIWKSTAASEDWSTSSNWTGGVPGSSGVGLFNGTNPSDGKVGFSSSTTTFGAISMTLNASSLTFGSIDKGGGKGRAVSLTGATIDGVANTVLSNKTISVSTLTLTPQINGNKQATYTLANPSNSNVIQISPSNTIALQAALSGTNQNLILQGGGKLSIAVPTTYTGSTTISSGIIEYGIANALNSGPVTINGSNAELRIASFNDSVGTITVNGGGKITGTSGILTSTGTFDMRDGSSSAILAGVNIPLTKTTTGTVTLTGASTYSGTTTISAGTLWINNTSGSGTGTGAITSSATSIFGGSGRIAPSTGNNITINGTLAVGALGSGPAQDFDIALSNATLNLTSTTITRIDLFGGYASGTINGATSADRLAVSRLSGTSTVSLNGILNLNLLSSPTMTPGNWTAGSRWQLFSWTNITPTGNFSSITGLPDLSGLNLSWNTSDLYTTGQLSIVSSIPEPTTSSLLLLGLLSTQLRRRRTAD